METRDHPIVFYDGECGLCSRSVRAITARDARRIFRFAPLGGDTYSAMEQVARFDDGSTIVVLTGVADGDTCFVRSDAVLYILRRLGGAYGLLATVGRWCPRPIRDGVYRVVTANRLRFFGSASACRLPTEAELSVLLP